MTRSGLAPFCLYVDGLGETRFSTGSGSGTHISGMRHAAVVPRSDQEKTRVRGCPT
jgi:hypothetical protein